MTVHYIACSRNPNVFRDWSTVYDRSLHETGQASRDPKNGPPGRRQGENEWRGRWTRKETGKRTTVVKQCAWDLHQAPAPTRHGPAPRSTPTQPPTTNHRPGTRHRTRNETNKQRREGPRGRRAGVEGAGRRQTVSGEEGEWGAGKWSGLGTVTVGGIGSGVDWLIGEQAKKKKGHKGE
jgi:hypothetical protein